MRSHSKIKPSPCSVRKTSFDCGKTCVEHTNKTFGKCLKRNPEISKFESPVDSTKSDSIHQGALKDELEDSNTTTTWNKEKVKKLHSCLVPFSISIKVEEDI